MVNDTTSNSDPAKQTAGNIERDNEYYFELVVFKVGNTIFRVPKSGLVLPGSILEAMFSLPTTAENTEGLNDQNPICLPVNEEKFRGFLRAMYPFNGLRLGTTDWLGALDLSTMWMFDEMRNRAIQALGPWIEKQSAKEVVFLAKKYRVLKWLKAGYTRLLQQSSLTVAELSAMPSLDWETIARLLSAKLLSLPQPEPPRDGWGYSTDPVVPAPQQNLLSVIEEEFREEFSGMN